jgi:pimeloyl-ACP methyl ester carboxylesterase
MHSEHKTHHVVIVPGLGDDGRVYQWVTRNWPQGHGLTPHIHLAQWKKDESFDYKLLKLTDKIDDLLETGRVSLIGISAGGSMVINASAIRDEVDKTVCVCSRLRMDDDRRVEARWPKAFVQAVIMCQARVKRLNSDRLTDTLTLRALFDEIVPDQVSTIPGAVNEKLPYPLHVPAHYLAMTFPKRIVEFIKA